MNHCMLDIETLGLEPTAVVLSLGAVFFDELGELLEGVHYVFNRSEYARRTGFTTNVETVVWWMQQSEDARKIFAQTTVPIVESLADFSRSYAKYECKTVWANGVQFDIPILENLHKQFNMVQPWRYNQARDYRTVRQLFPDIKPDVYDGVVAHNALSDARFQARHLVKIAAESGFKIR